MRETCGRRLSLSIELGPLLFFHIQSCLVLQAKEEFENRFSSMRVLGQVIGHLSWLYLTGLTGLNLMVIKVTQNAKNLCS